MPNKYLIIFIVLLNTCCCTVHSVLAKTIGVPAPTTEKSLNFLCSNSPGVIAASDSSDNTSICWLQQGNSPGMFNHILNYKAGDYVNLNVEFADAYFPENRKYLVREFICKTTSAEWCTMAQSFDHIDGAQIVQGNTIKTISESEPDFGGNAASLTPGVDFSICLAFIDEEGMAWRTGDPIACADAKMMPDTPSTCRINAGNDLNVDLGTLEYGDISTSVAPGSIYHSKKDVSVSCSGDAAITVNTQFQYQPLQDGENELVSTSNDHLGIAIFLDGKIISSSKTYTSTYVPGNTNLEFEFQPVRITDKLKASNAYTGPFSASLIMVMTVQ